MHTQQHNNRNTYHNPNLIIADIKTYPIYKAVIDCDYFSTDFIYKEVFIAWMINAPDINDNVQPEQKTILELALLHKNNEMIKLLFNNPNLCLKTFLRNSSAEGIKLLFQHPKFTLNMMAGVFELELLNRTKPIFNHETKGVIITTAIIEKYWDYIMDAEEFSSDFANRECLIAWLKSSAGINTKIDEEGNTLLHRVALNLNQEALNLILANPFTDISITNNFGNTPLSSLATKTPLYHSYLNPNDAKKYQRPQGEQEYAGVVYRLAEKCRETVVNQLGTINALHLQNRNQKTALNLAIEGRNSIAGRVIAKAEGRLWDDRLVASLASTGGIGR